MSRVAKTLATSYQPHAVQQALQEALSLLGGLDKFIQPHECVLIKPNMVEAMKPEKAVTVHPEVLRALIQELKKIGVQKILVGDSPGYQTAKKVGEISGLLQVCMEENVSMVEFTNSTTVHRAEGMLIKKLELADIINSTDKIISLAKMKTHSFAGITGAVKNLFGLVIGTAKAQFHLRLQKQTDFAAMTVDIHDAVRPVLSIIDGIVGMEGSGPRNGTPISSNILIASTCAFSADAVMCTSINFDREKIPLFTALKKHPTPPNLDNIEIVGSAKDLVHNFLQPPNYQETADRFPPWLVNLAQKQLTSIPVVNSKCIACGRCAQHCPPSAIVIKQQANIDHNKCIRCYCCQEFCPVNAIDIVDGSLLALVKKVKRVF